MVNSYLCNGNIIDKIDFDDINLDEFKYQNEFDFVKSFYEDNFMTPLTNESYVKKILNHFKGHLNLSLRYLICNTNKIEDQ